LKRLLLAVLGTVCILLGLIGLVVPVFPGFLFLLLAVACFTSLSPRLRSYCARHPRLKRFFARIDASQNLAMMQRLRLGFWAALEVVTAPSRSV